jgi:hypothetical protein
VAGLTCLADFRSLLIASLELYGVGCTELLEVRAGPGRSAISATKRFNEAESAFLL